MTEPHTKRPAPAQAASSGRSGPTVEPLTVEVLIVGGGLVGLSLATMLAGAGVPVAVVDRDDPSALRDPARDGRASALALGSQRALESAGLWAGMAAEAEAIREIRVSDGRVGATASALFLHYDHREVADGRGAGSDEEAAPLGYMVENPVTLRTLAARLDACEALTHLAPAQVVHLERGASGVEARLDDGRVIRARLAVAADGRASTTRAAAGIRTHGWRYGQTAIVCTLRHEQPHHGVAHECFLPAGPFAMLPLSDDRADDGRLRHRSSIVWTEKPALVPALMAHDDDRLAREIERRFGPSLGAVGILGRRWSYPLGVSWAERMTDRRLALVGDAAHAIHPIAGQGFNLGLRDVAALAELVVDALRLGLDPGRADLLARYQRWRQFDTVSLLAVTDGLNRLFSNDLPPLRLARDLGLAVVQRLPLAKRFFMRHAMGLVGDLPRLVQGRPL